MFQVRQNVAKETEVVVEELASDAEGLAEALDERKRMHRRRNAAASILQVLVNCLITLPLHMQQQPP